MTDASDTGDRDIEREEERDEDPRITAAWLGMILSLWADRQPDVPAVVSEHREWTFAGLNGRANQLARALRARGVGDGDGVALLCSNRPEFAEVLAATQRMGARLTPINWHLTGEEAGYIVGDCEAKVFVADARFGAAACAAAEQAPAAEVRLAVGGEIDGFEDYEAVVDGFDTSDVEDPSLGVVMLYTSGTTGRPKGVYRDQQTARELAMLQMQRASFYKPGEHRHLITGPLYHAAPLAISLTAPLSGGAGVVMMDGWDAEESLRLIEQHRITHTHMVPTMFHRLLSLPAEVRDRYDLSSLRYVMHGAAPCPVPVKKAMIDWWGPIIHEYYAATEGGATLVRAEDWLDRPGTVGKPRSQDHVRILDEHGNQLGPNEIGDVFLRADDYGRFHYFKDDDKTARAYRDNYFTLGDVGYMDDDGWLYLTDRSAHLIISGGVNIYPAEVEAVLLTHPAVGDAAVIGVPSTSDMGEDVMAVIEPQPGVEATDELGEELLAFCRDHLAHYKCPRHVDLVASLPRGDNGKLYKQRLREEYRARFP